MQSTLIILISGLAIAVPEPKSICPKTRSDVVFDWEENDDTAVLYDKNGDICLTGRFSIDVIIDDGGFIEDERTHWPEQLHVQTKNYTGICAGEVAVLGTDNVTGPAIFFEWSELNQRNEVLIQWTVSQGKTYLNEIKINLTVPNWAHRKRYLSEKLTDLHLFPTEVGKPVNTEEINIYFRDSSKGCLKFKTADYTITATFAGLSVVTVVMLAIILGIMMALGLMFYHRGSQKNLANTHSLQT